MIEGCVVGMDRSVSSVSTTLSSVDVIMHNTLNPVMELSFHVQIGGIFEPCVDETDLASIAHSCHFYPWYFVTRREPTIPLDALLDPFFPRRISLQGTIASKCIFVPQLSCLH